MRNAFGSLSRTQITGFGVQVLFAVVVPLVLLPGALYSGALAAVFAAGLVLLIVAGALGLERAGSLALILAFGAAPWNNLRPFAAADFITFSDLLFTVGFVLLIPHFAGKRLQLPTLFMLGALGIIVVGSVTSIGAVNVALSFNHLLRFGVGALGLALMLAWWNSDKRTTIAAMSAYVAGNGVNVLAAYHYGSVAGGRYAGFTTHPNVMGMCGAIAFAMTPFLLGVASRRVRWLVLVGAGISFWTIWISGSRAAMAAVLVIVALYPLLSKSVYWALIVAALGVVSTYVVDFVARKSDGSNALERLLGGGSTAGSNEAREKLANEAVAQFREHPILGGGLAQVMEAHSIYLQILAALGIVGLAFFVLILFSVVRPLLVVPAPYGLLAAPAVTYVMAGAVSPLLWDRYIWCGLAVALMAARLADEDADGPEGDAPVPRDMARFGVQR